MLLWEMWTNSILGPLRVIQNTFEKYLPVGSSGEVPLCQILSFMDLGLVLGTATFQHFWAAFVCRSPHQKAKIWGESLSWEVEVESELE